jgi:hypothetical protein
MKKDLKQAVQRLRKEGLILRVEPTSSQHWKLHLWNGDTYIAAATSSDWRACLNLEAAVRRTVKKSLAQA